MIWEIPSPLQDLIIERALGLSMMEKSHQGDLPKEVLAKAAAALAELSETFTVSRSNIKNRYLDDPNTRAAYLLYFLPSNLPKIWYVLDELSRHPAILKGRDRLRILDLGAGVGTASIAAVWRISETLPEVRNLEIVAVDNTISALSDCRWFVDRIAAVARQNGSSITVELRTEAQNVEKYTSADSGNYDLIFLSNSLNELFRNTADPLMERTRYLDRFCNQYLADDGAVIIIEPALLDVSRSFHIVRNQLIDAGWHLHSPCVSDRQCPMLLRDRDWCHHVLDWHRPRVVKQLDEMIGNRKEHLKFSYIVLRKDNLRASDVYPHPGRVYRAVDDLQREKGKDMIYLCGSTEPLTHTLLKRDRSNSNRDFVSINRGDLVEIERKSEIINARLSSTDAVRILSEE